MIWFILSDDDYRVLRQNLFETFAPVSAPPVEAPVVKSVEPGIPSELIIPIILDLSIFISTKGILPSLEPTA